MCLEVSGCCCLKGLTSEGHLVELNMGEAGVVCKKESLALPPQVEGAGCGAGAACAVCGACGVVPVLPPCFFSSRSKYSFLFLSLIGPGCGKLKLQFKKTNSLNVTV